jgi:hypothetical protein
MRLEREIDKVEEWGCDKGGRRALGTSCRQKLGHDLQENCLTGQVSGREMTLHNSCCVMHCLRMICRRYTSQHAISRPVVWARRGKTRRNSPCKKHKISKSGCTHLSCEGEADAREASVDNPGRDRLWLCWECSERLQWTPFRGCGSLCVLLLLLLLL